MSSIATVRWLVGASFVGCLACAPARRAPSVEPGADVKTAERALGMSDAILLVNTMDINPGQLEGFQKAVSRSIDFVRERGPQLMVEVYVDEKAMRAVSFQLHRDSQSMLTHWKLSDPHIQDVMKYSTVRRLDIYGQPNDEVMAGMRSFAQTSGVEVTTTPHFVGFTRLQEDGTEQR